MIRAIKAMTSKQDKEKAEKRAREDEESEEAEKRGIKVKLEVPVPTIKPVVPEAPVPYEDPQPSTSGAPTRYSRRTLTRSKRIRSDVKEGRNINATNDDVLRLILQRLTLQEQIHLRIICRQWKAIIEQICAGKQSLKIFLGKAAIQEYYDKAKNLLPLEPDLQLAEEGQFNDDLILSVKKITKDIRNPTEYAQRNADSHFISNLFPAITSLAITAKRAYFPTHRTVVRSFAKFEFPYLWSQWPALTTLIFGNFPASGRVVHSRYYSARLTEFEKTYWTAINAMPELTSLYILQSTYVDQSSWHMYTYTNYEEHTPDMTIAPIAETLSRLTQFTYCNNEPIFNLDYFLQHLRVCTKMTLKTGFKTVPQARIFREGNENFANLAANLTNLHFGIRIRGHTDYFGFICENFKALEILRDEPLDLEEWAGNCCQNEIPPFNQTVKHLAKLPKLRELTLSIKSTDLFAPNHEALPTLTSLKVLHMNIYVINSNSFEPSAKSYPKLQRVFRNIEQIRVSCHDDSTRREAEDCFTEHRFPALKQADFYHMSNQMYPPPNTFLGTHADYYD